MKLDINDRPQTKASQTTWRQYATATVASVLLSGGMAYLYSTGWRVTIDLQKLKEAFVVNGKVEPKSWSDEIAKDPTATPTPPQPQMSQRTSVQPKSKESSAYYVPPKGTPPIDWDTSLRKFNSVFIHHPSCNPNDMKWTQMDCSNFRARAMKRFSTVWSQGAYWNGEKVVENKVADRSVNSEI